MKKIFKKRDTKNQNEGKISVPSQHYKDHSLYTNLSVEEMDSQKYPFLIENILKPDQSESLSVYKNALYRSLENNPYFHGFGNNFSFHNQVPDWVLRYGYQDRKILRKSKPRTTFSSDQIFKLEDIFRRRVGLVLYLASLI